MSMIFLLHPLGAWALELPPQPLSAAAGLQLVKSSFIQLQIEIVQDSEKKVAQLELETHQE